MILRSMIAIAFGILPISFDAPDAQQPHANGSSPGAGVIERMPRQEAGPILGTKVIVAGSKISGMLVDVLVDQSGQPRAAVIDLGGFLGIGDRRVAVAWAALHFAPSSQGRPITLSLDLDQLKNATSYTNPDKPAPVVVPAKASPVGDARPASE